MNPGDIVPDASRTGPYEASGLDTVTGQGNSTPALPPRSHKALQDIQDIIDKLAAVTQQLRRPGSGMTGPSN